MDKLMENPWFLRGVALVLAFLLFLSVPDGGGNKASDANVPASQKSETLTAIPVRSYFDTDNFVVSGVPKSVKVTIQGPKSIVQTTKSLRDFEVYVDLSDAKIGTQKVKLKVKNISDKLKVKITPDSANITLQEKVTKEFKVEAEYNSNLLEDGFKAEAPKVEPSKVKVTGAKGDIERISYVKATVDLNNAIQETVTKDANVLAFDRNLNKLDVSIEPERVKVTIPIKTSSRIVPINIIQKGTPQNGIKIEDITLDSKEAKIIGEADVVKATEGVRVEVDVTNITDDTVLTLPTIVPEGIAKVTPTLVKATIKTSKHAEKTISNVPIKTHGLGTIYDIIFREPENGHILVSVSGSSEFVNRLTASDLNVTVNVSNLAEGEHEVPISAKGPSNVTLTLEQKTARVSIVKKEA